MLEVILIGAEHAILFTEEVVRRVMKNSAENLTIINLKRTLVDISLASRVGLTPFDSANYWNELREAETRNRCMKAYKRIGGSMSLFMNRSRGEC